MSLVLERTYPPVEVEVRPRQEGRTCAAIARLVRRHVYLPACLVALAAVGLIGIGWSTHWGGADFVAAMTNLRVVVIGPATLVILGALMIAERIWPAQKRSPIARGYRHDLLFTIFNATLVVPFVAALTLSFSVVLRTHLSWLTFPRIGSVPRGFVIAGIFIAMDGCNWLAHFANHRVRVLWRFHELHHSQEDMNALTVFRTHPLIHVAYLIALLPGIVLVANGSLTTDLLVGYGGAVALAHSNIRLSFGPLDRVFVSPNFHRIHHRLEGAQDVNLGFALSVWDHLFGRAILPTRASAGLDTGLPGRPLAVEFGGPKPRHLAVFGRQLVGPFRPISKASSGDMPETSTRAEVS